jgi:hypothetical protein
MKCLTVCEPMGSAIIFGGKRIENRKRSLGYVGPVLIQAGLNLAWFTPEICQWAHERWAECPASPVLAMHAMKARMGKVIGIVWMGGAFRWEQGTPWTGAPGGFRWATGPWCHPAYGARALPTVKVRGQRGLFDIPGADLPAEYHAAADDLRQIAAERGW